MSVLPTHVNFAFTPLSDLEDIFLHLESLFKPLPEPKSTVEGLILRSDYETLMEWFQAPNRWESAYWCEDRLRLESAGGATRQEMFGALFLILAANSCRDHASDDAVWPAVTKVLHGGSVYSVLFAAGQPTVACKNIIAAGARRLGLRNLIDRYGKQEYFETLKLQFGFTYNGAVKRLGDWLDGLAPLPVKILSGEIPEYSNLKSESFIKLWKTLRQFRKRQRAEEYTRKVIQESPWVRAAWADELLKAAGSARTINFSEITSSGTSQNSTDQTDEHLCEPILIWKRDETPQLILRVNDDRASELLNGYSSAEFQIDDRTVGRWTLQENGKWQGERKLLASGTRKASSLRPKTLSIKNRDEIIEEIDLKEVGLHETLIVFDLVSGTLVSEGYKLDPRRDYGLVCAADLSCPGASKTIRTKDSHVYRIDGMWAEDLKVFCEGALYWEPRISEKQTMAFMPLTMRLPKGTVAEIDSTSKVYIDGIRDDALKASLILGNKKYPLFKEVDAWRTDRAVGITLALAVNEERVRVQVEGQSYTRSFAPKLELNLRGIARRNRSDNGEMRWITVNLNRPLERADGVGQARIFSGQPESYLSEGFCHIGPIGPRSIEMRDLQGWGAPLWAADKETLVNSVEDHGLFRFIPNFFGRETGQQLIWRSPTPPRKEHRIVVWSDLRLEPQYLDTNQLKCELDGIVWKLPQLGEPSALAITYDGMRLGSWFHSDRTLKTLRSNVSAQTFAILRWLKIPILNDVWRALMRETVHKATAEFVRGWLDKTALPSPLLHREAEDGVEVVLREFLWDYCDRDRSKIEAIAAAIAVHRSSEQICDEIVMFKNTLMRLSDVCPSLAYSFADANLRDNMLIEHIQGIAVDLLSRPQLVPFPQLYHMATHTCADLVGATHQEVEHAVVAYADQLEGNVLPTGSELFYLRRLGETESGRRYIAAGLLFRLSARSLL